MSLNWYKHLKGKIVALFSGKERYRAACRKNWKNRMLFCSYLDVYTYFRLWKVTYNADGVAIRCSFQVRKDGANYENIPLPLCDNSTHVLRLFATIFDLPYRHNLKRKELLENLDPILSRMTQRRW